MKTLIKGKRMQHFWRGMGIGRREILQLENFKIPTGEKPSDGDNEKLIRGKAAYQHKNFSLVYRKINCDKRRDFWQRRGRMKKVYE